MFTPRDIRELEAALDGGKLLELRRDWNAVLRGGGLPEFKTVVKQNECILKHACRVSNKLETRFVGRAQLLNKKSEWRKAVLAFADSDRCPHMYSSSIYLDIGHLPTVADGLKDFNFSHYFRTKGNRANQTFVRKNGEGLLKHPTITGALGAYVAYRTKSGHDADVGNEVVAYASARTFHWWNVSHELAHGQCVKRSDDPPHNLELGGEDYSVTKGVCKHGIVSNPNLFDDDRTRKYRWVNDGTDGNGYVPKLRDVIKYTYLGEEEEEEDAKDEGNDTAFVNVNPNRSDGQKGGRVLELHVVAADPKEKGIGRFMTLLLLNHFQTKKNDSRKGGEAECEAQCDEKKFKHIIMEQVIPDETTGDGDFRGELKCTIKTGVDSFSNDAWHNRKNLFDEGADLSIGGKKVGTITTTKQGLQPTQRYVFVKLESYGDKEKFKDKFEIQGRNRSFTVKIGRVTWAKDSWGGARVPEVRYKWEKLLPLECAAKAQNNWSPSFEPFPLFTANVTALTNTPVQMLTAENAKIRVGMLVGTTSENNFIESGTTVRNIDGKKLTLSNIPNTVDDNENTLVFSTRNTDIGNFKLAEPKYHHHIWWGLKRHSSICDMVNTHNVQSAREAVCRHLDCDDSGGTCSSNEEKLFLVSPRDIVRVIRATQKSFNYLIEESGIANMKSAPCPALGKNVCNADGRCQWEIHTKTTGKCRNTKIQEVKKELRAKKMNKVACH